MCNQLAANGIRVIVAGLDMDYKGVPFGPMPELCAIADEVTKVHAICVKCGRLAYVSHRIVGNDKRVFLGEQSEYEPLCRECYAKAEGFEELIIYPYICEINSLRYIKYERKRDGVRHSCRD